ncbi:MAG TPA: DUF559 domain-containing protein [Dehalococcoidia bacterium]|nr:DUF559 domain-containing protein [Dehalococcoidia bacterium]
MVAAMSLNTQAIDPELRGLLAAARAVMPDAYLVGGAVRDLVLGRKPYDLDFVTPGDTQAAAEALARGLGASAFALDDARGHYRLVFDEHDHEEAHHQDAAHVHQIDVAPLHADGIEADLRRRDFTVDAMAAPLLADGTPGALIDPTDGLRDLDSRTLRMTGEAALREDPLRLLRAVRLAVELELTVADATADAVRVLAASVTSAAAERQRDELVRIFVTPRAAAGVRLMDGLGLLSALLPELDEGRGVEQPPTHHYYDVFDHSVETLAALDELLAGDDVPSERPWLRRVFREAIAFYDLGAYLDEAVGGSSRRALLKLAGLLHDVAKPETKTLEADGRTRFFGHAELGAETAMRICGRLRFGGREAGFIGSLIEEHLRPMQLSNGTLPSRRALYRFFRDLGEAAPGCLVLSLADAAAAQGPRLTQERWSAQSLYIAYVLREGSSQAETIAETPRLITGHDLIEALQIAPGPELGRLIEAVEEAAATGEVTTREEALALAKRLTSPPAAASPSPSTERGIEARAEGDQPLREWTTNPNLWARIKPLPQEMRRTPTPAEDKLWQALRRKQLDGQQFRRQHPIDRFVVDFYCPAARLVVELDGPVHRTQAEADRIREEALEHLGVRVLRFDNELVMTNLEAVLDQIRVALADSSADSSPSPWTERGTEGERSEP